MKIATHSSNELLRICAVTLIVIVILNDHQAANKLAKKQSASTTLGVDKIERLNIEHAYYLFQQHAALFIDIRPASYFQEGHIPGAINIPELTVFPENDEQFKMARNIIVYGNGTAHENELLSWKSNDLRLKKIHFFSAGILQWEKMGLPLSKCESEYNK